MLICCTSAAVLIFYIVYLTLTLCCVPERQNSCSVTSSQIKSQSNLLFKGCQIDRLVSPLLSSSAAFLFVIDEHPDPESRENLLEHLLTAQILTSKLSSSAAGRSVASGPPQMVRVTTPISSGGSYSVLHYIAQKYLYLLHLLSLSICGSTLIKAVKVQFKQL